MINYGSDIGFAEAREGNGYSWIASADGVLPNFVFFRENQAWFKDDDYVFERVIHCLSHEPIHCALWGNISHKAGNTFDIGRRRFLDMLKEKENYSKEDLMEIVVGL